MGQGIFRGMGSQFARISIPENVICTRKLSKLVHFAQICHIICPNFINFGTPGGAAAPPAPPIKYAYGAKDRVILDVIDVLGDDHILNVW